jgi:hypothetical protein
MGAAAPNVDGMERFPGEERDAHRFFSRQT